MFFVARHCEGVSPKQSREEIASPQAARNDVANSQFLIPNFYLYISPNKP